MKSLKIGLLLVPALIIIGGTSASAMTERRGDQGLGLLVGNPSGVTWKMWLDNNLGLDAVVGVDRGEFDVHTTLLWHDFSWSHNIGDDSGFFARINHAGDFPFYFGAGPRVLFANKVEYGIRFPLGLCFLPHETNWEFFGEVAPVLRFTPDVGFNGDVAVGVRYYFPAIRPRAASTDSSIYASNHSDGSH